MVTQQAPSNIICESIDIYRINHIYEKDLESPSCDSIFDFRASNSMKNLRSSALQRLSQTTPKKLRRRILSGIHLKISRRLRSNIVDYRHRMTKETPALITKQKDKVSKTLYESLIETELQQYTKRKMTFKESVLVIINSQDGSRFLQGLLKDLPKECFRLLFIEVSFLT